MSSEPLKPCPFCDTPLVEAVNFTTRSGKCMVHARVDFRCSGVPLRVWTDNAEHVAAWNRRAQEAEIAALKRSLEIARENHKDVVRKKRAGYAVKDERLAATEAEIAALRKLLRGANEAWTALDIADRIIERACGVDTPAEWGKAYRSVAKARSAKNVEG